MGIVAIAIVEGHDPEELGLLPDMVDPDDPRPAAVQFNENYQHGGGWQPIEGFKAVHGVCLVYPGDPMFKPIAFWPHGTELIVVYRYSLVAVFDMTSKAFEVARMD